MRTVEESIKGDEREENPIFNQYQAALEQFKKNMEDSLRERGLRNEVIPVTTDASMFLEAFILDCGLVQTVEALVRTCDQVAGIKVKNITDNALKRTWSAAAREQGIRISQAGDLAHRLNATNVEVKVKNLHIQYVAVKTELETVTKLSHEYENIKVPKKLIQKAAALKEQLEHQLSMYEHLAEKYTVN